MKSSIQFRPIRPADEPFLYRLYASTRPDIAMLDAPDEMKANLYEMQFRAQSYHYHTYFSDADFLLVLQDGKAIGRLYVHRAPDEIRIIDIALIPAFRSQGIGTKLLTEILQEGRVADKPVRIHVEKANRAMRFYERLGFVKIAEKDYHWLMECSPSQPLITS